MFGGIFVVNGLRYHIYMLEIILKRLSLSTKQNGDIFVQVIYQSAADQRTRVKHCCNK